MASILAVLALEVAAVLVLAVCARIDSSRAAEEKKMKPERTHRQLVAKLRSFWDEPAREVDIQWDGEDRLEGTVERADGAVYSVQAKVSGHEINYQGNSENGSFAGQFTLERPTFEERHHVFMQAFRVVAFCVCVYGTVYPLVGAFGLRRRFGRRMEILLYCCSVVNVGFAVLQAYTIFTVWNAA